MLERFRQAKQAEIERRSNRRVDQRRPQIVFFCQMIGVVPAERRADQARAEDQDTLSHGSPRRR